MKVNIQKLARVITPILACCLILVCSVFPTSAEGVDYTDYIVNVFETDGVNMVQVSIPATELGPGGWYVRPYPYTSQTHFIGHAFTYHFLKDTTYRLSYYPFQGAYGLNADDIPSGTHMSISVYGTEVGLDGYSTPKYRWIMIYRDANQNNISDVWTDPDEFGFVNGENWKVFTVEKPSDTAFLYFYIDFIDFEILPDFASADSTIGIKSLDMVMTLDSLYLQQIQSGKTNKLLAAVEKKLEEQGKTLEEILNGSSDMQLSAEQIQAAMDKAIADLNSAGNAMQTIKPPKIEVEQILPNEVLEGQEFLAYTAAIKKFWDSPVLTSMFAILGGLMFVSYVLFGKKG